MLESQFYAISAVSVVEVAVCGLYLNNFSAINVLEFGEAVKDSVQIDSPFQQVQHVTWKQHKKHALLKVNHLNWVSLIKWLSQQLSNHLFVYQPLVNQPLMGLLNPFADQMLPNQPLVN